VGFDDEMPLVPAVCFQALADGDQLVIRIVNRFLEPLHLGGDLVVHDPPIHGNHARREHVRGPDGDSLRSSDATQPPHRPDRTPLPACASRGGPAVRLPSRQVAHDAVVVQSSVLPVDNHARVRRECQQHPRHVSLTCWRSVTLAVLLSRKSCHGPRPRSAALNRRLCATSAHPAPRSRSLPRVLRAARQNVANALAPRGNQVVTAPCGQRSVSIQSPCLRCLLVNRRHAQSRDSPRDPYPSEPV
jgi:hypothetical protein